jgi:hypothetical protein
VQTIHSPIYGCDNSYGRRLSAGIQTVQELSTDIRKQTSVSVASVRSTGRRRLRARPSAAGQLPSILGACFDEGDQCLQMPRGSLYECPVRPAMRVSCSSFRGGMYEAGPPPPPSSGGSACFIPLCPPRIDINHRGRTGRAASVRGQLSATPSPMDAGMAYRRPLSPARGASEETSARSSGAEFNCSPPV